jgi:hypothetical protein
MAISMSPLPAIPFPHTRWNANGGAVRRDVRDNEGVSPDRRAVADSYASEYLRTSTDVDIVPDDRCSGTHVEADIDILLYPASVANDRIWVDGDIPGVYQVQIRTDICFLVQPDSASDENDEQVQAVRLL